jgi:hypothetical protein
VPHILEKYSDWWWEFAFEVRHTNKQIWMCVIENSSLRDRKLIVNAKTKPNFFLFSEMIDWTIEWMNEWMNECHVRWVACYHSRVRLRVANGGTVSGYGGLLRIYWISSRGQTTRDGPPASVLDVGLTTLHSKKINLLRRSLKSLGPVRVLWINAPSDGIRTRDLDYGM